MRYQGRITNWKDDQGFGFITTNGGSDQVFVHINGFSNRKRRPAGNEIVTYNVTIGPKGRKRAENVVFVSERTPAAASHNKALISIAFAIFFVAIVTATVLAGKIPTIIFALYLGASLIAFAAYALDKSAAKNDQWRTPESTLHLFGIIGGWPGALVAQRLLRHKSKKQSFQFTFWVTVILNCGGFIWLLTPDGTSTLNSILTAMA
jgi:uncharacterized membrane protein YsdA (DUF1294 family)/cold shock CspA family protein